MTRLVIRTGQHITQLCGRHSLKAYAPLFPHHYLNDGVFESGEEDSATHEAALRLFSLCEMFQLKPVANVGKVIGCDASRFAHPLAFATQKGAALVLDFPSSDCTPVTNTYWDELEGWNSLSLDDYFGDSYEHDTRISTRRDSGVDIQVIRHHLCDIRK